MKSTVWTTGLLIIAATPFIALEDPLFLGVAAVAVNVGVWAQPIWTIVIMAVGCARDLIFGLTPVIQIGLPPLEIAAIAVQKIFPWLVWGLVLWSAVRWVRRRRVKKAP